MNSSSSLLDAGNNLGTRSALSVDEVARVQRSHRRGVRARDLAQQYGVSVRTIYRNLKPPRFRCRECGRTFTRRSQVAAHVIEEFVSEVTVEDEPPRAVVQSPPSDWRLARPARPRPTAPVGTFLSSAEYAILGIVPGIRSMPQDDEWFTTQRKRRISAGR